METLRSELFERPFYVYFLLAFVELGVLAWWRARPTRWRTAAMAAAPVLALAVFLTARLVVTDRERIEGALAAIVADVNAGGTGALDRHLAETVKAQLEVGGRPGEASRADLVARVAGAIRGMGLHDVRIEACRTELPQRRMGRMQLTVSVGYRQMGIGGRGVFSWVIHWHKKDLQWQIYVVELTRIGR